MVGPGAETARRRPVLSSRNPASLPALRDLVILVTRLISRLESVNHHLDLVNLPGSERCCWEMTIKFCGQRAGAGRHLGQNPARGSRIPSREWKIATSQQLCGVEAVGLDSLCLLVA